MAEQRPAAAGRRNSGTRVAFAAAAGSSSPSTPASCTGAPSWAATTAYATTGTKVSWKGHYYTNRWWSQGEDPTTTGQWGVWNDLGPC
ncbi:hypothetical protein [Kitasatospora sp. GP82]|uniref:hypothetical protein n=1 Tax=Kitasatospora sp. GP82 TaxID=3035089 RepID=UPI002474D9BB|nr:hypothetical protein [Kitasatospora sp. GP82]